jgi:hypothetical protein
MYILNLFTNGIGESTESERPHSTPDRERVFGTSIFDTDNGIVDSPVRDFPVRTFLNSDNMYANINSDSEERRNMKNSSEKSNKISAIERHHSPSDMHANKFNCVIDDDIFPPRNIIDPTNIARDVSNAHNDQSSSSVHTNRYEGQSICRRHTIFGLTASLSNSDIDSSMEQERVNDNQVIDNTSNYYNTSHSCIRENNMEVKDNINHSNAFDTQAIGKCTFGPSELHNERHHRYNDRELVNGITTNLLPPDIFGTENFNAAPSVLIPPSIHGLSQLSATHSNGRVFTRLNSSDVMDTSSFNVMSKSNHSKDSPPPSLKFGKNSNRLSRSLTMPITSSTITSTPINDRKFSCSQPDTSPYTTSCTHFRTPQAVIPCRRVKYTPTSSEWNDSECAPPSSIKRLLASQAHFFRHCVAMKLPTEDFTHSSSSGLCMNTTSASNFESLLVENTSHFKLPDHVL